MLGLKIDLLEISAITNGGEFSVSIPFSEGLNIIRAENSSGKSTCINAIAYGLGLEAILGPSRKRPFPKSLYDEIFDDKDEQNPFFVTRSFVSITISNSNGSTANITRDVAGDDSKVIVVMDEKGTDFFLGSAGSVGSVVSERGFHNWLAIFIGWVLPNVVTFDDKETKLYLECIFPLFFIEQKRGWSEIQANIPTHYGIRSVKKSAAEFCLGIDSFEHEKKVASLRNQIEEAKQDWEKIISVVESVAEFNSVRLYKIPPIESYQDSFNINYYYLEGDTEISVFEQERSLARLMEELSNKIVLATPDNEALSAQMAVLRALRREMEGNTEAVEITMLAVSEVEGKLVTLTHDLDQYQQLRRLKTVGSEIDSDMETEKCPICESDLYDTLGNRSVTREPMTLSENVDFLKNQIQFYRSIKNNNIDKLHELQSSARLVKSKIGVESEKLEKVKEDLNDINGTTKSLIRAKIQTELQQKEVSKLKDILEEQKLKAVQVFTKWSVANGSLRQLKRNANNDDRVLIIRELEAIIKTNLVEFNFNPSAINSISISKQSLRPEQEGYDIVAETSASDYIRVIWAYTLALMELAGKNESVTHGGFVAFDEPRQHEASKLSFSNLIKKASQSDAYNGQVIFATSLEESEVRNSCEGLDVNLVCFDNYILKKKVEKVISEENDVSLDAGEIEIEEDESKVIPNLDKDSDKQPPDESSS